MAEVVYTEAAEIAAASERVFDYRLDFTNLTEYNPNVSNLRRTDPGTEPGPGAEYLFDLTLPGLEAMETPLRVLESDRPGRIVFETGPAFMARESCAFSPVSGGTRAEFTVVLAIPGEIEDDARAAIESQGREQVRLELDLMKKILEA